MNNTPYSIHANPDSIPVIHSNWYPPVAVTEKNLQYAQILMPDLAAAASEMTTVHQYLYQSWTAGSNYNNESCKPDSRALHKNIRRVIQRIAVVEQHHFTIIGQLITLLGGGMPFVGAVFILARKYGSLQLRYPYRAGDRRRVREVRRPGICRSVSKDQGPSGIQNARASVSGREAAL